jgi:hypothetical protein
MRGSELCSACRVLDGLDWVGEGEDVAPPAGAQTVNGLMGGGCC